MRIPHHSAWHVPREDNSHAATAAGDIANCAVALDTKAAGTGLNTVDVQLLPGNGVYATG